MSNTAPTPPAKTTVSRFLPLPTETARALPGSSVVLVDIYCGAEDATYQITISKTPRGGKGLVVAWSARTDSSIRGGWATYRTTIRSEAEALDFAASKLAFLRGWSATRSARRAA